MHDTSLRILNRVFGYDHFRGAQAEIIAHVLGGGDALVLMPTGGGKSLCYQIPALLRPGVAVVISPLIALMQDQVDALRQLGVKAAYLNSMQTAAEAMKVEEAVRAGALDLVYVAPERLLTERFLDLLGQTRIALFAIDEAHCVSRWGHDFRPEYTRLDVLHARWPEVPRIALTATADAPTRAEILSCLGLGQARQFVSSFDRPNIRYRIVEKSNPHQQFLSFLRAEHPEEAGIVYCLSRRKVEETAAFLESAGFVSLPYHAGLPPEMRRAHQARFLREDGLIMVATIAFGMGIDKPDVRFVAHLDLPKSIEAYYQETGRAGRDGEPANAWMAYGISDLVMLRRFIAESTADEHFKRIEMQKLDGMLGFCETTECRRQVLLGYFGEPLASPCGNCDTCLEPVATLDGTVLAQKALSCIYRTGQRFGALHLVDVLLGKDSARIRRLGHEQISTYGIGRELSAAQWRSVYRQLIAAGLVAVDLEGHGALRLTEQARPVLRGERRIRLRQHSETKRVSRDRRQAFQLPSDPEAVALWEALRQHRRAVADALEVPAYHVFSDVTLREMLLLRPLDRTELSRISGVGQVKLERFGEGFLGVLAAHEATHGRPADLPPAAAAHVIAPAVEEDLSDTVRESIERFRAGESVATIAAGRLLKVGTVYNHLAQAIARGELSVKQVVGLDDHSIRGIELAIEALPNESSQALKPVYDSFDGRYDYGLLRCVRAGMGILERD